MDTVIKLETLRANGFFETFTEYLKSTAVPADSAVLTRLIAQWLNLPWAADAEFLGLLADLISKKKPCSILECGSGLSTLIIAALCRDSGANVFTLEHSKEWVLLINELLAEFGLADIAKVAHAPLRPYGEFFWYAIDAVPRNSLFDLIVCDGPPGTCPGGRFGLVPLLKKQFMPETVILLDDAKRPAEKIIVERWCEILNASVELSTTSRGCAIIKSARL